MEMEMQAMNEGEEERDWACLLPDVLNLIAKCLSEIFDFVRFRAVCHAWRTSTPVTDFPLQFPWIVSKHPPKSPDPNLRFYSIPFNKTFTIPAPSSLDNKYLLGLYSHGYIVTLSQRNHHRPVSLFNPLTNHEIYLPEYPSGNHHWIGPRQNQRGEHVGLCYGRSCSRRPTLVFCHHGQSYWHKLKLDETYKKCHHFYLRGMLFSVHTRTGVTKVTSIANDATPGYVVPPPFENYEFKISDDEHLIEDTVGDILRVSYLGRMEFHVYRLDVGNKNGSSPCWVKVSDIGTQAIFIDMDGVFVLRAGELSQIKRNSIYLLKCFYNASYKVWRIEIDTCKREGLQCPLEEYAKKNWLVPNLHHL